MPVPPLDVGSPVLRDVSAEELELEEAASCGCETAPSSTTDTDDGDEDPYAPAESLRLRIGEDIDWSDVVGAVAAVLERDDSTKGAAANPKCAARRSAAAATARSSLSSSAPAVSVVIGGKAAARARDHGRRRRRRSSPCQLQLGGGRASRVFASSGAEAAAEPGSPKVSCLGGVRSHSHSHSQPRTAADEGITDGRRRWAWLAGCWWPTSCLAAAGTAATGWRPRASEAE